MDDAGHGGRLTAAIAAAIEKRNDWLASLPAELFVFGQVRHDPPWHIKLGPWAGPTDIPRTERRVNMAVCGKLMGRAKVSLPDACDDICFQCIAWVDMYLDTEVPHEPIAIDVTDQILSR